LPAIAEGDEVGVFGNLDRNADFAVSPKPAPALPSAAIGRIRRKGIRRYLNGAAGAIDFPETAIACPSAPVGPGGRIFRHANRRDLGEGGARQDGKERQERH